MSVRSSAAISGAPDFAAFLQIPILTHAPRGNYWAQELQERKRQEDGVMRDTDTYSVH